MFLLLCLVAPDVGASEGRLRVARRKHPLAHPAVVCAERRLAKQMLPAL
jgi:hypothetical protein